MKKGELKPEKIFKSLDIDCSKFQFVICPSPELIAENHNILPIEYRVVMEFWKIPKDNGLSQLCADEQQINYAKLIFLYLRVYFIPLEFQFEYTIIFKRSLDL